MDVTTFNTQSDATAAAPLHHRAGQTPASGLITCQELDAKHALSSLLSGDCVLPRITEQLSGNDRDDLLRHASSPEAATRVFIWQVGPRTPAQQNPLHSAFPSYFMNVSAAAATADGTQLASGISDGAEDKLRADAATLRRVRKYSALYSGEGRAAVDYSPAADRHHGATDARSGPPTRRPPRRGQKNDHVWSFMKSVRAAVRPITSAVALVVDVSGIDRYAQRTATEVDANLRVFAWRSATAWTQLFMRRRVVLRIHIGSWGGRAGAEGALGAGGEGEDATGSSIPAHSMRSRMEMSNYGSLSLVRVISFPPVVQLKEDTPTQPPSSVPASSSSRVAVSSFACSLPAVHSASLLLQEDAMARVREAKQAAAAFPRGWQYGTPRRAPPTPRVWLLSVLMDAIRLAARALLGTRRDEDDDDAVAAWSRVESISVNDGVTRTAAVAAARSFLDRVREELGPHQSFGESILPVALQQMLGRRTMHAHAQLVEAGVGVGEEEHINFFMQWEASLPAGTPMCLALAALPPPPSHHGVEATAADTAHQTSVVPDGLPVSLEETCSFDVVWLQLFIVGWAVWELERRAAQSTLVRYLATGLSGMMLLLVLLLWYVIRRLHGASPQLAVVAMALLLGGSTAMANGLLDVVRGINSMIAQLSESAASSAGGWRDGADSGNASSSTLNAFFVLGVGIFVLACAGSGIFLSWLVPPVVLLATTRWCVRALLLALWGLCVLRNTEATAVAALLWSLWCVVPLARIALWLSSPLLKGKSLVPLDGNPVEEVPPNARQACGYAAPLAVSSGSSGTVYAALRTPEARLKRYEEEGVEYTRRALEELATHLRANPGRYATRLRNPNGVQQWAGTADTETDEETE
ncbi:hypothetical protein JKF63_07734 [Porcisia hertigi]|uniref:Uncharacterized protein n=1 Tax=Porcisia hertigi TaxID=2761500 RepID=A0A836LLV4_9TRYP|nr:hypothetical protein JKF63_07734 [Porcisia hertigi]